MSAQSGRRSTIEHHVVLAEGKPDPYVDGGSPPTIVGDLSTQRMTGRASQGSEMLERSPTTLAKPKPVLFLGVEGVLTTERTRRSRPPGQGGLDEACCDLLSRLSFMTDATIVLTRDWRPGLYCERQFAGSIVRRSAHLDGRPPVVDVRRDGGIERWLRDNPAATSYAILDSQGDVPAKHEPFLVRTDPAIGLQDHQVRQLARMLRPVDDEVGRWRWACDLSALEYCNITWGRISRRWLDRMRPIVATGEDLAPEDAAIVRENLTKTLGSRRFRSLREPFFSWQKVSSLSRDDLVKEVAHRRRVPAPDPFADWNEADDHALSTLS